jgi:hypothetical protein
MAVCSIYAEKMWPIEALGSIAGLSVGISDPPQESCLHKLLNFFTASERAVLSANTNDVVFSFAMHLKCKTQPHRHRLG